MKLRWFKDMLELMEDYKKHKGDLK